MAAIDKVYLNSYEEYIKFKEWCKEQPPLSDKYGRKVKISEYLYEWNEDSFKDCRPVFMAPYYVDAYVIRNCPIEEVQKELMLNYGHWTQERIKSYYNDVINWSGEEECPYWTKEEDFITLDDGSMTIKGLEKSDYEMIKDGELFTSPKREDYKYGKHFKCIKHPNYHYNRPFGTENWFIGVVAPGKDYMWYHSDTHTWDFYDEFVTSNWASSATYCKTIKALKRLMLKWKLPIGTKVRATGRFSFDDYEFIITK